jgi:hypothetical protein
MDDPPVKPIDGEILEITLDDLTGQQADVIEKPPRRVEDTRANLAYFLVGLLAFVLLSLVGLLACGKVPTESFAEVAGLLVSPLIGLVGAVVGYYYGKTDKR